VRRRSSVLGEGTRPPPARIDCASLDVDERIDPATAPDDHFGPGFPARCPIAAGTLFLDLETTGLGSGALVALAGTLRTGEDGALRLRQRFAFDPADERGLLEGLLDELGRCVEVVTYNGGSFDLPLLERRLDWHRLPPLPAAPRRVDLLVEVRRRFRGEWPDCTLATVEERLLGKRRLGPDVPGAEVPLRFADVREGAPLALLAPVARHNRIDLTSLVALHLRLSGGDPKIEG